MVETIYRHFDTSTVVVLHMGAAFLKMGSDLSACVVGQLKMERLTDDAYHLYLPFNFACTHDDDLALALAEYAAEMDEAVRPFVA